MHSIAAKICEANDLPPLKVFVVESEEINAFCTGGGLVQVNTALIDLMETDGTPPCHARLCLATPGACVLPMKHHARTGPHSTPGPGVAPHP